MIRAAAALTAAAALIHGSVIAAHFREYWLFGLFFALVTPLQLTWGWAVTRGPAPPRALLVAGAAGSAGIVALWIVSRTAGLPFGPESGSAEVVGYKDVLATACELGTAALVAVHLRMAEREPQRRVLPACWTLAAIAAFAALLPGH